MKIKDIQDAIKADKRFTFTNVKIHWLDHERGDICMNNHFPSIENQPVNLSLDIKEISVYEQPKYDPCRKFRKGDKVRLVKYKNRTPYDYEDYCMVEEESLVYTLPEDEAEDGFVYIDEEHSVCVCYLELFMPVEELEPYYVHECKSDCSFEVCCEKQGKVVCRMAYFWHSESCRGELTKEQAKAAAEAERDRLNAEHRKEMEK